MNQQYLKGISSTMAAGECVIFPATAGNIVSFLKRTRTAERSEIRTLDGWKFLTSMKDTLIDICPDIKFLEEKIRPFLERVKQGREKIPKLPVLKPEDVRGYKPPKPDWNCLYWKGVSNEAYASMSRMTKPELLEYSAFGRKFSVQLKVEMYLDNGNLAIQLYEWNDDFPEPWAMLTVNLSVPCEKDCAYIDTNNNGRKILEWIVRNDLGKMTGRERRSGYCSYPEVHFNAERLRELDPDGYEKYEERFRQAEA